MATMAMVAASREAQKSSSATTAARAVIHNTTVTFFTAVHYWWIFLHVNLAMVIVAVLYQCMHKFKITRRYRSWHWPLQT